MTLYIYASKNVKSGNFNKPMFERFPKEDARETYEVSFKETPKEAQEAAKELEIYYLGTMDTKTGEIKSDCEFILSGSEVIGA